MQTNLAHHIATTPLIDTHEHLNKEDVYVDNGPDVLADLFGMYIGDELIVAGAPFDNVVRLLDSNDPDVKARWEGIEPAWLLCQHTGYGEAVRNMAQVVYGIDELNLASIEKAAERNHKIRQPGQRLHLLRDIANLDHVQVDDFVWACSPDQSGTDFFLYDISWVDFASARFDVDALEKETSIKTIDLGTLRDAISTLIAKYAPLAVAMKSQHAYERTLMWRNRDDSDAEKVLQRYLTGATLSEPERLCLGDWCLGYGIEQASKHNLPIKIHTGFLAGHRQFYTDPDRTRAAHLAPLLANYPDATFVLMHIAYPYSDELIAIAKHFPSTYIDMCWSWSINPRHASEFVRRSLHGLPINKVFLFGGDCQWPTEVVGFATQTRRWLNYTLQCEIDEGFLNETQAIEIASHLMQKNQRSVFDLEGTRNAIAGES